MRRQRRRKLYVAGIVERSDNRVLIVRPDAGPDSARQWRFPYGEARSDESPEDAMRRIARDDHGVQVEIVVGQPPLLQRDGDREVELRYFFCGVVEGDAHAGPHAEIRWIVKAHLREYEFDAFSRGVVDWLLES